MPIFQKDISAAQQHNKQKLPWFPVMFLTEKQDSAL